MPFGGFTAKPFQKSGFDGQNSAKSKSLALPGSSPLPESTKVFVPTTTSCWSRVIFPSAAVTVQSWLAGATNMPVLDRVSDDPSELGPPVAATFTVNANARSELIGVGDLLAAAAGGAATSR